MFFVLALPDDVVCCQTSQEHQAGFKNSVGHVSLNMSCSESRLSPPHSLLTVYRGATSKSRPRPLSDLEPERPRPALRYTTHHVHLQSRLPREVMALAVLLR
ncbi:hypothetical protein E2C01_033524 [Portunus trituberculatus]|uniref:Uncharacterized protein n=1 Tax=Portunus trituberculatus TaxID=210409 RepID=A0A5B7EYW7_PORTR|nr:hypothetical protein [Portunus trituberculatus]